MVKNPDKIFVTIPRAHCSWGVVVAKSKTFFFDLQASFYFSFDPIKCWKYCVIMCPILLKCFEIFWWTWSFDQGWSINASSADIKFIWSFSVLFIIYLWYSLISIIYLLKLFNTIVQLLLCIILLKKMALLFQMPNQYISALSLSEHWLK